MSQFKSFWVVINLHLVSWLWVEKYQIYLQKKLFEIFQNKISSILNFQPTLNLGAPTPNLGAPTPWHQLPIGAQKFRVGPHKFRVGYFFLFKKKVNVSLPWPPKVTKLIAFLLQCQGPLIYTYRTNWWTSPLMPGAFAKWTETNINKQKQAETSKNKQKRTKRDRNGKKTDRWQQTESGRNKQKEAETSRN